MKSGKHENFSDVKPGKVLVQAPTLDEDDKLLPMNPLIALPQLPLAANRSVDLVFMRNLVNFCQKIANWNKSQACRDTEFSAVHMSAFSPTKRAAKEFPAYPLPKKQHF